MFKAVCLSFHFHRPQQLRKSKGLHPPCAIFPDIYFGDHKTWVTSLPPTTASRSISFNRMAVLHNIYGGRINLGFFIPDATPFGGIQFLGFAPTAAHVNKDRLRIKQNIQRVYIFICYPAPFLFG
jgi:hypothetical protein